MKSGVLIILLLCVNASVYAEQRKKKNAVVPPEPSVIAEETELQPVPRKSQTNLQAGLNIYQFDYKEELQEPKKSTEKGVLPGISLGITHKLKKDDEKFALRGLLDLTVARTNYDGSTQGGDPRVSTTSNTFINIEGDFLFLLSEINPGRTYLRGYTGLGTRSWTRDLEGLGGYREDYSWNYLPVGLRYETAFNDKLSMSLEGTLKLMFGGRIKVYDIGYDGDLGSKPGYKFSAPLNYKISQNTHVTFSPWIEYSEIGEGSKMIITDGVDYLMIYEPASRTIQYGGVLGISTDI